MQREKQNSILDAMRQIPGALVSGGKIEVFRKGWAIYGFSRGKVGHYFERNIKDISQAESLCGLSVDVRWLFGLGNYPKCSKCRRIMRWKRVV